MRNFEEALAIWGKINASSNIVSPACGVCCSQSGGGNEKVIT